jgi:hypothetical protein
MSWLNIFIDMLNSGTYTMIDINNRIKLYRKYNLISEQEKNEIYATLLHDGYFTKADLDTYVSQGYITEQEKLDIITLEATY